MRLAVFTVCPNHRVPQARVLLDTVARFLPDARRFLVLADEPHPSVPYPAGCQVIPARALGIPDFPQFAFRYDPAEFAAALKPFAFRFLLDTRAGTHCLFLDPGIELFSSLPAVTTALEAGASVLLAPNLLSPEENEDGPGDLAFLRDGAFNLGFLGVSGTAEARNMLGWWARWLRRNCVDDRPTGFNVDQRFMDLVPGFVSGARILHDPGLAVAPWNLLSRGFVPDAPGGPRVDGAPLGFFHYAGFDPDRPDRLDTEPEGRRGGVSPALRTFLAAYADRLHAAGHGTIPPGSYAWNRFASGVPVPAIARRMFRDDHEAWAGDPFDTFEDWCHLPARDAVLGPEGAGTGSAVPSLMMQWLQARRPELADMDLRDPGGAARLSRWWLEHGTEAGADPRFLQPLAEAAGRRPVPLAASRPAPAPDRADATVVAPLAAPGPAGLFGRALASQLHAAAGRVERLDVLAADTGAATGRVVVLCLPCAHLRPFLHVLAPRLPRRAFRVFVPSDEGVELSPPFLQALAAVDEVWAPTRFLQARLVPATGVPVLHMPILPLFPAPEPFAFSGRPYVLVEGDALPGNGDMLAAVDAFGAAFRATPPAFRPRLVVLRPKTGDGEGTLRRAMAEVDAEAARPAHATEEAALVAGAACVLLLHRGEALGLSVARALACGVSVVATDAGGCTDLLTPLTGFPVDARFPHGPAATAEADPCAAAWALREVFERPDEARRRSTEGRRRVLAHGGEARLAARLEQLGLLAAGQREAA